MYAQLSTEANEIAKALIAKGYPLPNKLSNESLLAEQKRIAALENYQNTLK